jgi:hypothetical protein
MLKSLGRLPVACWSAVLVAACSIYEVPPGVGQHLGDDDGGRPGEETGGVGAVTSGGNDTNPTGGGGSGNGGVNATSGSSPTLGGGGGGGAAGTSAGSAGAETLGGGGEGGAAPPDNCLDDPNKLEPGACGCGIPDVATSELSDCQSLKSALLHRYDFEGNGTQVRDRVGTAHGTVLGATLSKLEGKGVVLMGGGKTGAYVDLPNGLLSSLKDASFEAWITWGGGAAWQRVFDFGDSSAASPENNPANGKSYLFVTPRSGFNAVGAGYSLEGNSAGQELTLKATAMLEQSLSQVVVVANDTGDQLLVYVNGAEVVRADWTGTLGAVNDVNVWLGRSQYDGDPELSGVYHDFRVYGAALSAAQVASSYRGGPDPAFLLP